jgi:hypothetical protein
VDKRRAVQCSADLAMVVHDSRPEKRQLQEPLERIRLESNGANLTNIWLRERTSVTEATCEFRAVLS